MKLFIDFETYYSTEDKYDLKSLSMVEYVRDPRFKVLGFAYAIDDKSAVWIKGENVSFFLTSSRLLEAETWRHVDIIGHNIKFDGFILKEKFGIQPRSWKDTKGMARGVLGKRVKDYSLRTLAEYFSLPSKGQLKTNGLNGLTEEQEKELEEYCLYDIELCRDIFKRLEKEFPLSQYSVLSQTVQMFVEPRLELNVPLLQKAAKDEAERRNGIFEAVGIDKSIFASNKKFPELLKQKGFEVPIKKSRRTGKDIPALGLTDPEFIELVRSENEELKTLCEARVAAKSTLLETRSAKLAAIGITGQWPFDVEFSGAAQTHRFSGGSGAGGNPQNFTRNSALREAVKAPSGYSLIVGDFDKIEFRLVAYLSKDPNLIQALEQKKDIYSEFASTFYGRKITKQNEIERRFGKCAILGLGYGMGAKKFQKTVLLQAGLKISREEAQKAVDLYRGLYQRVPELWQKLNDSIDFMTFAPNNKPVSLNSLPVIWGHCRLILPSGLPMIYPGLRYEEGRWIYDVWVKKSEQEAVELYGGKMLENICQGLAGELCKEAFMRVKEQVTGLVHDEIHMLVPKGTEDISVNKLRHDMTRSPSWMPELKLEASIGVGKNWKDAK